MRGAALAVVAFLWVVPAQASPVLLGTASSGGLCCSGLSGFTQAAIAGHFTLSQAALIDELDIQAVSTFDGSNFDVFLTQGIGAGAVTLASALNLPSGANVVLPLNLALAAGVNYYVVVGGGTNVFWGVNTVLPGGIGTMDQNSFAYGTLGAPIANVTTGVFGPTFGNGAGRSSQYQLRGTVGAQAVPEPASLLLVGTGVVAMLRRRRKASPGDLTTRPS